MNLWSLPIFALIGTACFVLVAILQHSRKGSASYRVDRMDHVELPGAQRSERFPPRHRPQSNWSLIERVAVIMGIISFIIQVAQWIYPWL